MFLHKYRGENTFLKVWKVKKRNSTGLFEEISMIAFKTISEVYNKSSI